MEVLIILIAFLAGSVSSAAVPTRIVGGSDTTIEEFPFLVNIQYLFVGGSLPVTICGGSLITATTVLTTAYCFYQDGDSPVSLYRVRAGSSLHNAGGDLYPVSRIASHENYSPLGEHDIAILNLATPAVLSDTVRLAVVAGRGYNPPDDAPVTVVGWGFNGAMYAPQMKRADIRIVNSDICASRYDQLNALGGYQYLPNVTSNMVCAGFENGPCTGDYGSPLLDSRNVIVGLVSWNFACADAFYPDVMTRVSGYMGWILANAYDTSSGLD